MFNLYFPQMLIKSRNLLYDYECRELQGRQSIPRMRRFALICLLILHIVIWAYALLALALGSLQGVQLMAFALVSTGVGFAADLYTFSLSIGRANRHALSQQMDLLRLTPIASRDIVAAQVAISQHQVWRFTIVEALMRLIIIEALVGIVILEIPLFIEHGFTIWVTIPFVIPAMIAAALLYHEPQWRMRMITTLAYYLGMRFPGNSLAFMVGMAVVVGALALRMIIIYGFYYVVLRNIGPFTTFLWLPLTPFAFWVKSFIQSVYYVIERMSTSWITGYLR